MGTQQLGYYGKIPGKGDFVSHQLPRIFIEPWDQWLQECIVASHEQLCERWLECFLVSPIWRFALSKGICSETAWIGIMMPSVDKVGRYFPLTLAVPVNASQPLLEIVVEEEQWFANIELVALTALEQNNELAEFNQKIDEIGVPESLYTNNTTSQQNDAMHVHILKDQWRLTTVDNLPLDSRVNILFQQLLQEKFNRFSLWWTQGSALIQPSLLVCNDLLPARKYHTLLNGNWDS